MKYALFWGCLIPVKYPQMELAVRNTLPNLGVETVDIPDFSCCPDPTQFKAADKSLWVTLAARNLCLAEERGVDMVTVCSGCTATLMDVNHLLNDNGALREQTNQRLRKIGKEYKGQVKVKHLVSMLRDDVGAKAVADSVKRPLAGMRVAVHYGCHLLKPRDVMQVDDSDAPTVLEDLVSALGAEAIPHRQRLLCCGRSCLDENVPALMTKDVLVSVQDVKPDCMCMICPSCFSEFDLGQITLGKRFDIPLNTPVVHYAQLLGLAQGLSPEDLGLNLHKVKADGLVATIGG